MGFGKFFNTAEKLGVNQTESTSTGVPESPDSRLEAPSQAKKGPDLHLVGAKDDHEQKVADQKRRDQRQLDQIRLDELENVFAREKNDPYYNRHDDIKSIINKASDFSSDSGYSMASRLKIMARLNDEGEDGNKIMKAIIEKGGRHSLADLEDGLGSREEMKQMLTRMIHDYNELKVADFVSGLDMDEGSRMDIAKVVVDSAMNGQDQYYARDCIKRLKITDAGTLRTMVDYYVDKVFPVKEGVQTYQEDLEANKQFKARVIEDCTPK